MPDATNGKWTKICALLPLTLDRVGPVHLPEDEEPEKITSIQDAFDRFRPEIDLRMKVDSSDNDFHIGYCFGSIEDFLPERLQGFQPSETKRCHRRPWRRNDVAYVREYIRSLQHLQSFWEDDSVATAWANPTQRTALMAAITQLQAGARNAKQEAERIGAVLNNFPCHPFVPYSPASAFGILEPVLTEADSWQDTRAKLDLQIQRGEALQDELLRGVFREVRSIERSWRSLKVFFDNVFGPDRNSDHPPELYVFNVDGPSLRPSGADIIEAFIRRRNENFAFQDDISMLVVPGFLPPVLRARFEKLADEYGLVLLSDLGDEPSLKRLGPAFLPGGKYCFRSEERSSSPHVIGASYIQLRPAHWFEMADDGDDDGLFSPSSLIFASIADHSGFSGDPKGDENWLIEGIAAVREEVGISDARDFPINLPSVAVVRDPSGRLCFRPLGPGWGDPDGVLSASHSRAALRYLERCLTYYALACVGLRLTRDVLEEFEANIERILNSLVVAGRIQRHSLFVDKSSQNRLQGILDVNLEIFLADGVSEGRKITIARRLLPEAG